ncbi:MAG: pyruvate formate-lyase-activating protein [Candidatus Diapherotrites archaeon]
MQGLVHSVESFGTLDGPGRRYVIFMQGCPLRCKFCQNIDVAAGKGGKKMSATELFLGIERSVRYINGVTFSGGEPLMQAGFVAEVMRRCNERGIHTALDSCMYADRSAVETVLPYTSLFMCSVKHMDDKRHREITGRSNGEALANIRFAAARRPVRLRYVVVPGFTDAEADIAALAEFAKTLEMLECVELLPYSALGERKWTEIGLKFPLKGVRAPTNSEMCAAKELLENAGLKVLTDGA